MTKDLLDKYIWLVDTIYRAGRISYEEINDRWLRSRLSEGKDIPLRTFHNWRDAIEQVFDINIECDRRDGYRYYIENADDMAKGGIRNWLLNTFAVNNLINESHHLKRRIMFEDIPSGREYLTPVIEAMRDGLELELTHKSYWYEEPRDYTVRPYCVKVFRQRWYLVGYCEERKDMRIFSLDRIVQMRTTDTKFTYPKDFDPDGYFNESYGIIVDKTKVETVRVKAFEMQRLYLRALPLHHSQKEIETGEDYSVFEYRIRPTYDFLQEILSRGADLEVLSPAGFRERVIRTVNDIASNYGNR